MVPGRRLAGSRQQLLVDGGLPEGWPLRSYAQRDHGNWCGRGGWLGCGPWHGCGCGYLCEGMPPACEVPYNCLRHPTEFRTDLRGPSERYTASAVLQGRRSFSFCLKSFTGGISLTRQRQGCIPHGAFPEMGFAPRGRERGLGTISHQCFSTNGSGGMAKKLRICGLKSTAEGAGHFWGAYGRGALCFRCVYSKCSEVYGLWRPRWRPP